MQDMKEIVLLDYLLQLQISMCMLEIKISLYMCMEGKKKEKKGGGRQEIILVNYLVKISEGMLEIQISVHMWKGGRKERTLVDYVLQILISVYTLILTSYFISGPFLSFFFFFPKALCLKVRVSCVVNYFPCMSAFCGEGPSSVMFFLCC